MKINWYNKKKGHTGRSSFSLATIHKTGIYFPQPVVKNYKLLDYKVMNVGLDENKDIVVRFGQTELTQARNYTPAVKTSKCTGESSVAFNCAEFIKLNNLLDKEEDYLRYFVNMHIVDKDTIYLILERGKND